MNEREFCIWLSGFLDLATPSSIDERQLAEIKSRLHLAMGEYKIGENDDKGLKLSMAERKAAILALPEGSPKPKDGEHPLGSSLKNYMSSAHRRHDPVFYNAVVKKFPHWFMNRTDEASRKKAEILALDPSTPKPKARSVIGRALYNYVYVGGPAYDQSFHSKLQQRFPHWFNGMGKRETGTDED